MTNEISKQEWKRFFDRLSREKLNWNAGVEIFKGDIGAQVLSAGLPLTGVTYEEKSGGDTAIEIMLGGESSETHQMHTILNPTGVAFLDDEMTGGGTLEVEDADGGRTLVKITQPASGEVIYTEVTSIVAQI